MSPDKLAYMANQIGRFFAHQPHETGGGRHRGSSAEELGPADADDHRRRRWRRRITGSIRWCAKRLHGCAPADISLRSRDYEKLLR